MVGKTYPEKIERLWGHLAATLPLPTLCVLRCLPFRLDALLEDAERVDLTIPHLFAHGAVEHHL